MPIMKVVSGRSIIQTSSVSYLSLSTFCAVPPNLTPSVGADGILVCHYLTKRKDRENTAEN